MKAGKLLILIVLSMFVFGIVTNSIVYGQISPQDIFQEGRYLKYQFEANIPGGGKSTGYMTMSVKSVSATGATIEIKIEISGIPPVTQEVDVDFEDPKGSGYFVKPEEVSEFPIETVSVPAGTYECYHVNMRELLHNPAVPVADAWMEKNTGIPVKIVYRMMGRTNFVMELVEENMLSLALSEGAGGLGNIAGIPLWIIILVVAIIVAAVVAVLILRRRGTKEAGTPYPTPTAPTPPPPPPPP